MLTQRYLSLAGFDITSTRGKIPADESHKTPKTIEEFEEQEEKAAEALGQVGAGIYNRKAPEYTMNYQQAVTAEDVFLQVSWKILQELSRVVSHSDYFTAIFSKLAQ